MSDEQMNGPADARQLDRRKQRRTMRRSGAVDGEEAVRAAITAMPEPWRSIAERLDFVIRSTAPQLTPRLWYGLPAYALEKAVVCFFRSPQTFGERSLTFGFTDKAQLDEGTWWPVAFAITELGPAEEARVRELVQRAVGATDREPR